MRLAGWFLIAALVPAAAPAQTQQDENPGPRTLAVETSPIPRVKVLRPQLFEEDTEEGAGQDDDAQTAQPDDSDGDVNAPVRVVSPGEDGTVTVVFNGPDSDDDQAAPEGDEDQQVVVAPADGQGRFRLAPQSREPERTEPTGPVVPINAPTTDLLHGARLRQLDKMTGKTTTFDIAVGETRRVQRLQIRLDACRAQSSTATHGTMVFVKVWDTKYPDSEAAFSGWMFAESPALSALDHPRYDLWVISCTTSEG